MLEAYFDESWTQPQAQGVTAIAGYVAPDQVWRSVEGPWRDLLAMYADKGVKTFHAADCCGVEGYGEFAQVDTFHRMNILNTLSGILEKADVQPIWSAVFTEDWNNVVTDAAFLAKFPQPFHLCFEHVVRQLADWGRKHAKGERIAPMFARQQEFADWMTYASQAYGQFDWYKDVLGPMAFGYPFQIVPLQTADLLAHEISWEWDRLGYGPPLTLQTGGFRRLLDRAVAFNGMHVGGCFDANALRFAISEFKRTGQAI